MASFLEMLILVFGPYFVIQLFVSSHLVEEERAGCVTIIALSEKT